MKYNQLRILLYNCLASVFASEAVKQAGVKIEFKLTTSAIKQISFTLIKINQKFWFKFVTKSGKKEVI